MIFRIAAVLLASLCCAKLSLAQDVPTDRPFNYGQWIAPPGTGTETGVYRFHRLFDVRTVPATASARITADSQFVLLVNGQRIGFGPSKADLSHWKYETVDLAPYLHMGSNEVDVLVWKYEEGYMLSQMSHRVALLIESDNRDLAALDTSTQWQVKADPERTFAVTNFFQTLRSYYVAAPEETFHTSSDGGVYSAPIIVGRASLRGERDASTLWMLQADTLPAMTYMPDTLGTPVRLVGATRGPDGNFSIPAHSHATILLDHTTLTTGYPRITAEGNAKATITSTYAEALYRNWSKGNRNEIDGRDIHGVTDTFVVDKAGALSFEPLNWRAWRFVQLDISTSDSPLLITDLSSTFTAFPFQQRANFSTSSSDLERIWDTGWRTARLGAHDTYMDTPYWERLQYVGDTRIQALISYAVADDDRLARQAIAAIDESRLPEGLTQSRYPSSLPQIIPTFSLLWVDMLHDFWIYRNDPEFVRQHVQGSRAVLAWFLAHQKQNGLLDKLPWWNFVDWTSQFPNGVPPQELTGDSAVLTLQFIEALRNAAQLERALGDRHIAAQYELASARASEAVRLLCWDEQEHLFSDTPTHKHFSQHTNALAVILDLASPARKKQILLKITNLAHTNSEKNTDLSPASYYFDYYLFEALDSAGLGDHYIEMLQPWRDMTSMGLTTWAEKSEPTRSDSHAWSAHPNLGLLEIVAGIRPSRSSFASVSIEPHPGSLTSFDARYPHYFGDITVSMRRAGSELSFQIKLPSQLPGVFTWHGRRYVLHAGTQTIRVGF